MCQFQLVRSCLSSCFLGLGRQKLLIKKALHNLKFVRKKFRQMPRQNHEFRKAPTIDSLRSYSHPSFLTLDASSSRQPKTTEHSPSKRQFVIPHPSDRGLSEGSPPNTNHESGVQKVISKEPLTVFTRPALILVICVITCEASASEK